MNSRLFTRYLNSTAVFDAQDDARAAAEAQRKEIAESIKVADKEDDQDKDKEGDKENDSDDTDKGDDNKDDAKDGDEKDKEDDDDKEETEDEKASKLVKAKEDRAKERMQKRINRVTAEHELTKAENEELKKQLAAKKVEGLTEEEVNARAKKLADDMVRERETVNAQKQFEKDCDKLAEEALKIDKKFNAKINEMAQEVAAIPSIMIGILADLDNENGGAVLNYLSDNVDEYEDIHTLSEGRMTAKLIRLSDKIKAETEKAIAEAKAKAKKEKSNAPAPITPVAEGRDVRTANALPNEPTKNIDDFVRIRNQQEADRRKARGY